MRPPRLFEICRLPRLIALVLCSTLCTSTVFAAGGSDPVVIQLKRQGDKAIEAGQYDAALTAYTKALAVEPSPALHYNRARALQGLGRNADALDALELFDSTAPAALKAIVHDLPGMIRLVRSQVAELTVQCDTPDAVLRVNGKALVLPLPRALRFDPSNVTIELAAPGYEPWRDQLTLAGGEQRELTAKLKREDTRGTLIIKSSVSGAFVNVDGKAAGTVPVELRLAPGEHRVALRRDGYEPAMSRVVLRPKEHRSFSLTLQRSPAVYERWWFWTAVGAVLATGAVVGIAASTEKPAAKGDIPPGRLTAKLASW